MVLYKCERCGYETSHKSNFIKHENRKKPCETPDLTCTLCNKSYVNRGNLTRHMKKFHPDHQISETCCKEEDALLSDNIPEKEIQQIKNTLLKQLTTTNNTTNNTTNINQMNVIINSFGDENISYITEDFLTKLICSGVFNSIPKLIKQIPSSQSSRK